MKTKGLSYKNAWILLRMKSKKEFAQKRKGKAVPKNVSALTKRTMKQIAIDQDAKWE